HIIRGVAETPPLFVIGVKVLQLAGHTPPPPDRCSAGIFENLSLFVSHLNTGRTGPAIQFPAYYTPAWTRRPMRVTPGVKDVLQELARPKAILQNGPPGDNLNPGKPLEPPSRRDARWPSRCAT